MLNVYLDPVVFSLPSTPEKSDVEALIESVMEINTLNDSGKFNVFKLKKTLEVLAAANAYPVYPYLEQYFSHFGIDYVQVADVMVIIDSLLSSLPMAEDSLNVNECIGEDYYCCPNYFLFGQNIEFITAHDDFMTLLLASCENEGSYRDHVLFISSLERDYEELTASCKIQLLEPEPDWYAGPCSLKGKILAHRSFSSIEENVNNMEQFLETGNPLYLKHFLQEKIEENCAKSFQWALHDNFCSSFVGVVKSQAKNFEDKIVRAMLCTLFDEKVDQVHKIRESIGGNSKQIQRESDKSKAWRRDVDYEFHIHYWKTDTLVEFALVVPHNCFHIPE